MNYRVPYIYNDRDTVMHRRDPRAKILAFGLLISLIYAAPTWEWILGFAVLGGVLVVVSRVPPKWVIILFAAQLIQAGTFVAYPILGNLAIGNPPLYGDFSTSLKFTLSWPAALFTSAAIFTTMELTELTDGLRALGVPELAVFTLEYVFLLFYVTISDLYRIADAMKVKGLHIETKNPVTLVVNLPSLGIPMFIAVLKRSNTMMAVLKMRGYEFMEKAELRTDMKFDVGDALLVLGAAAILGTTLAARFGVVDVGPATVVDAVARLAG